MPNPERLRIFHFQATGGDQIENAHMTHADPFLAFLSLKEDERKARVSGRLIGVDRIKIGEGFYDYRLDTD